jgi:predicted transcriptional regulator
VGRVDFAAGPRRTERRIDAAIIQSVAAEQPLQPLDAGDEPAPAPGSLGVVLSIKPRFAELIARGEKRVEFRRRFAACHAGCRVWFYASTPARVVRVSARVARVVHARPDRLWRDYRACGGVGRAEFDAYFEGCARGAALELTDAAELSTPRDLAWLRRRGFVPPMSYRVIRGDEAWARAIAV